MEQVYDKSKIENDKNDVIINDTDIIKSKNKLESLAKNENTENEIPKREQLPDQDSVQVLTENSFAESEDDKGEAVIDKGEFSPTSKRLSKNQEKKLKRLENALKYKAEKRKKERENRKLKGKTNYAVVETLNGEKIEIKRKQLKKNLMANSSNKLRLVVDCSFENLMNYSDINHLTKQLTYCYAANRRIASPLQFHLTSMNNKTKELLDKSGLSNWDVHLSDKNFMDVFADEPKENIVYLTSDSPNELVDFDENKVYIIGGLVDHNHHKFLSYNLAIKNNISHSRLPISKFMKMKTRPVLTVNQVFQIVCKYTECKDWKLAFMSTLPKRKGAETLDSQSSNEEDSSDEESTPSKKVKQNGTENSDLNLDNSENSIKNLE